MYVGEKKDRQRGRVPLSLILNVRGGGGHDKLGRDRSKIHRPDLQSQNRLNDVARVCPVVSFASVMIALWPKYTKMPAVFVLLQLLRAKYTIWQIRCMCWYPAFHTTCSVRVGLTKGGRGRRSYLSRFIWDSHHPYQKRFFSSSSQPVEETCLTTGKGTGKVGPTRHGAKAVRPKE